MITDPLNSALLKLRSRVLWRLSRRLGHRVSEERITALAERYGNAEVISELERTRWQPRVVLARWFGFR
jgi:hypothetical protein